ncbi:MAG: HAD-IIA family hydrolase [Candidatus Bipolaricaulota bacterium]
MSGLRSPAMHLDKYAAFVLDIDGVLVRDRVPLPGAVQAVKALAEQGAVVLLTNNSTRERETVAERLAALGFPVSPEQIVTSAFVAAHLLRQRYGPLRVWPVGEAGLLREIAAEGHTICDPSEAQWVVAGMDRQLTYSKLSDTLQALISGARFLATNRDATFPMETGQVPGAGAVIGAIEGMGFSPELVVGKPSDTAFRAALELARVEPEQALMVGDRPETDIAGASAAGMDTALVLTGVADRQKAQAQSIRPTWIADDLAALAVGEAARG